MSTSKTTDVIVSWLDLPTDLTEKILERLQISDYIRFAAVCPRWRSIQQSHRQRHSSSRPPMLSLPWFIPYRPRQESMLCSAGLLLSHQQHLRIPLPPRYLNSLHKNNENKRERWSCSALPYGWLLLDDDPFQYYFSTNRSYEFTLLNPITGVQIQLPRFGDLFNDFKAAISPPPRSDVFVLTFDKWGNKLHLYRQGDPYWTFLWFNSGDCGVYLGVASVIYYQTKFYCIRLDKDFMVLDPPSDVRERIKPQCLEMDQTLLPKDDQPWPDCIQNRLAVFLVESNGKMLLVCKFFEYDSDHTIRTLLRFELFEADLSNMKWVKAEGLGDQALIIYETFVVSLVATDVGVKQNCIYVLDPLTNKEEPAPWNMFDLSTGEIVDALLPCPPPPSTHLMFVPNMY